MLSDEQGNAVIVGYNEDARKWFVDTTTPVRLPVEWVTGFMADLEALGNITGLENPRELHDRVVRLVGVTHPTIPSLDEIAEYLAAPAEGGSGRDRARFVGRRCERRDSNPQVPKDTRT